MKFKKSKSKINNIKIVDIPEEIQGKSLKPLLTGEEISEWRDAIYYHYYKYPTNTWLFDIMALEPIDIN
jgi:hypothetical protein